MSDHEAVIVERVGRRLVKLESNRSSPLAATVYGKWLAAKVGKL